MHGGMRAGREVSGSQRRLFLLGVGMIPGHQTPLSLSVGPAVSNAQCAKVLQGIQKVIFPYTMEAVLCKFKNIIWGKIQ